MTDNTAQKIPELVDMPETFLRLRCAGTAAIYRGIWARWCAFCALPFVAVDPYQATEDHALRFAEARLRVVCPYTARNQMAVLHAIYHHLQERGAVPANPFVAACERLRKAHVAEVRPSQPLTEEQARRLLSAPDRYTPMGKRDRAFLALLFSGFRLGEVLGFNLQDFKQTLSGSYYMVCRHTKSGHLQTRAISQLCAERVAEVMEVRRQESATDTDPLLSAYVGRAGHKHAISRRLTAGRARAVFRAHAARAGLPAAATPHWGRCTAVSWLRAHRVDPHEVCAVTGHASPAMVEYYDRRTISLDESPGKMLNYGLMSSRLKR